MFSEDLEPKSRILSQFEKYTKILKNTRGNPMMVWKKLCFEKTRRWETRSTRCNCGTTIGYDKEVV